VSVGAKSTEPGAVTLVIPTYERREMLRQTLASVAAQTRPPVETIVVDDGSADGSAEMVAAMGLTVLREPGGGMGPALARRRGSEAASTDLVAFLDSDDLLRPRALELMGEALASAPGAPFSFGRSLIVIPGETDWTPAGLIAPDPDELADPLPALFARNFVPPTGTIFHRAALEEIGGYPTEVPFSEDHYLALLATRLGDPAYVPEVVSAYRWHGGNRNSPALVEQDLEHYLALAEVDPRLRPAVPGRLGVTFCEIAVPALRAGDLRAVAGVSGRVVLRNPHRAAILRRAGRHWRSRRRWAANGPRLWARDPELRDWLAGYPPTQ
jgi:glycosyltransferase involved in cell wall biosynthesis